MSLRQLPLWNLCCNIRGSALHLEIKIASHGYLEKDVAQDIAAKMGKKFIVRDRDAMNADLLRAIRVEKLFVAVTLSFIILVAAINIFFSLSMLAIEKKKDVSMLYALGATPSLIRNIFLAEGAIVALSGAIVGILCGILICWLQMSYGFVSMGMSTSLVDAYPVKLIWQDILLTGRYYRYHNLGRFIHSGATCCLSGQTLIV